MFKGDEVALHAARIKINEEFKKNKNVNNKDSIKELLQFATEVENELKTSIVQAKQKTPGIYG